MTQAKSGNTVKVHYTGTLDDGSQFDSSVGGEPLEVTLGGGQVIPGFEQGIEGMQVGETKQIHIPVAEAYGDCHEELIQTVDRDQLPEDVDLQVGMQFQVDGGEAPMILTVTEVTPESATLDGNHPMAGNNLNFELELVELVS
ncbi:MAG: peptidylprolyl isomerase [Gammaproteobacteria bacterium]|nr:peptidylprolyl isomerase [Gammaproteobacteria bacterium]